ncbi:hypothetical protein [Teredinibacter haidensis]|uniref:hypothetical protein n=1 Tax=Teredinibacter haidensis TaxID=2731755 RepID=UPI000948F2C2|nr:hypothetical protein [Teredinibacter haidensis]
MFRAFLICLVFLGCMLLQAEPLDLIEETSPFAEALDIQSDSNESSDKNAEDSPFHVAYAVASQHRIYKQASTSGIQRRVASEVSLTADQIRAPPSPLC